MKIELIDAKTRDKPEVKFEYQHFLCFSKQDLEEYRKEDVPLSIAEIYGRPYYGNWSILIWDDKESHWWDNDGDGSLEYNEIDYYVPLTVINKFEE